MNQFDLKVIDGHLTFVVDGLRVLVDTGSPFSFSRNTQVSFLGREYPCGLEWGRCDMDSLSENAGFDFDVLMGMGILGNYRIVMMPVEAALRSAKRRLVRITQCRCQFIGS